MSERKQAKADLLVRVRYSLPLPPPPFPPRLLNIPTNSLRYGSYETLQPLAQETALPLILDGELGLPLEVGKLAIGDYGDGSYWMGDRSAAAPTGPPPGVAEDDLFLLAEAQQINNPTFIPGASSAVSTHGAGTGAGDSRKKVDVSWLRRTEYLSSEAGLKLTSVNQGLGNVQTQTAAVELPRDTRATAIASTFTAAQAPLSVLRHPTKAHLTATESWPILPDQNLWANTLDLIRFGEDPGEDRNETKNRKDRDTERFVDPSVADPRLHQAIFRPLELPSEDPRIGYYLPADAKVAKQYSRKRANEDTDDSGRPLPDGYDFTYVRDYEVANTRRLKEEFVIVFEDGPAADADVIAEPKPKRPRAAYYTALGEAQTLRKRRPRRGEDPTKFSAEAEREGHQFWNGIRVQVDEVVDVDPAEAQYREEMEADIAQPPVAQD